MDIFLKLSFWGLQSIQNQRTSQNRIFFGINEYFLRNSAMQITSPFFLPSICITNLGTMTTVFAPPKEKKKKYEKVIFWLLLLPKLPCPLQWSSAQASSFACRRPGFDSHYCTPMQHNFYEYILHKIYSYAYDIFLLQSAWFPNLKVYLSHFNIQVNRVQSKPRAYHFHICA